MPTVSFSPIGNGYQLTGLLGQSLPGGFINTYIAGGSTPAATYTTSAGTIANTNPIQLDASGHAPFEIWLVSGTAYKFVVTDSLGVVQQTYDNIVGINDPTFAGSATYIVSNVVGTNTITGTTPLLQANCRYQFISAGPNTGAVTLNLNGTGALSVLGINDVVLTGGEIKDVVDLFYDGIKFYLMSYSALSASGGSTLVGLISPGTGAVATTVGADILSGQVNAFRFFSSAQQADVSAKTYLVDVTAALNAADVYATSIGATLYLPPGGYSVTAVTFNAPHVVGHGWLSTIIKGSTAADNIVTLPSLTSGTLFENIQVISSVAAGSRTGAGIKITGGVQILLRNVVSNGHKYGFWNQGGGNEFEHCFAASNNSHGFFFDSALHAQNEIGVYMCQSNSNGGNGYELSGVTASAGLRFSFVTAYSNTGIQFHAGTGFTDIWLVNPEMGGGAGGLVFDGGTSDIQLTNPFIENTTGNYNVVLNGALVSWVGGFIQASTNASFGGILCNNADINISGVEVSGNDTLGIRLGASSSNVNMSAIEISNTAATGHTTTTALLIDGGAGAFTWVGGDCNAIATKISGTIPTGSLIRGVRGVADYNVTIDGSLVQSYQAMSMVNGLNSNLVLANGNNFNISGPSLAFSLGGLTNGVAGRRVLLYNQTGATMTIVNLDASSSAANQIVTNTGANVVVKMCELVYSNQSQWNLLTHSP